MEAGSLIFNFVESIEPYNPPTDSTPAMSHESPSIKSEIPNQSPAAHSLGIGAVPDSGLGIITQEDMYGNAFHSTTEQENMPVYTSSEYSTVDEQRKLASPFEEQIYASTPWAYPQTTMSAAGPSVFHTPVPQFLSPQGMYPSMQYSLSPASYTPNMPQHLSIHHPVFRQPTSQYSTSVQSTPVPESQWTPQNTMSWQTYPPPAVVQPPTFVLNHYQDQWYNSPASPQTAMTVPLRRKPHLRPSLSESMVPRISSPVRLRAASTGHHLQPPQYDFRPQLPLPPLPRNTPMITSSDLVLSDPLRRTYRSSRSSSSTPTRRKRPVSPPASDFKSSNAPYLIPVKQNPVFSGDLYTPKYKRRTANGRWEGWCGYCQPGRWLDLKNSRYWEDKLRNHGICAKTKMKFEEPAETRKVNPDGTVDGSTEFDHDLNDPFSDQKRREGLCSTCGIWVAMDGLRTKARDRAVGWWMHAYKVSSIEYPEAETNDCSAMIMIKLRTRLTSQYLSRNLAIHNLHRLNTQLRYYGKGRMPRLITTKASG